MASRLRSIVFAATLLAMACTPDPDDELRALLKAEKFEESVLYTGVHDPADKAELIDIVNGAIRDIIAMPQPRSAASVRGRLARIIQEADLYETEDRERAYRYMIMTWRAAGFDEESGLLPVSDERVFYEP